MKIPDTERTFDWYAASVGGIINPDQESDLRRLSEDLDAPYLFEPFGERFYFRFQSLDCRCSLQLVKMIIKYGIEVTTDDPVTGSMKANLTANRDRFMRYPIQ